MRIQTTRPQQGKARRRSTELMMGTALGGALMVLGAASPAVADNECGAPVATPVPTATCTIPGGPYTTGITYNAPGEIVLRLDEGVEVSGGVRVAGVDRAWVVGNINNVTGADNDIAAGVSATGSNAWAMLSLDTVTAGANGQAARVTSDGLAQAAFQHVVGADKGIEVIAGGGATANFRTVTVDSTSGSGYGVSVTSNSGHASIEGTTVNASGDGIVGVIANGRSTSISVDEVTTTGNGAGGISATSGGGVNIDNVSITTTGDDSKGIAVQSTGGLVEIDTISVTTGEEGATGRGDDSTAIYVHQNGAEVDDHDVIITVGTETTDGSILTWGDRALGIDATSVNNDVTIFAQNASITTHGAFSDGIVVNAGRIATVRVDSVTTTGEGSTGIVANGDIYVEVRANAVTTTGDDAVGIIARSYDARADVQFGTVTTTGENSNGVFVEGERGWESKIVGGSISTSGDNAIGLRAVDGNINIDVESVTTTGAGATAVQAQSNGGTVTINADTVTTSGGAARGIEVTTTLTAEPITVDITSDVAVTTTGDYAEAVFVDNNFGDVTINLAAVTTGSWDQASGVRTGESSTGVFADASGKISIEADSVVTNGDWAAGVIAYGDSGVSIDVDTVRTFGEGATGIHAYAGRFGSTYSEPLELNIVADVIETAGEWASAVSVGGEADADFDIAVGTIRTQAEGSSGIFVSQTYFDQATPGEVLVTAGDITTRGDQASGIAVEAQGAVTINLTGSITTGDDEEEVTGFGSDGIYVDTYGAITVNAQNAAISTVGRQARGVTLGSDADGAVTLNAGSIRTEGLLAYGATMSSGAGAIRADIGSLVTTGSEADGLWVKGEGGITVNIDDLSTSGDDAQGVFVEGGDGRVFVDVLRGRTTGVNSHGVEVMGSGEVELAIGAMSASGASAYAVLADGREIDIAVTGAVNGMEAGLMLTSREGAIIDNSGAISSTEGYAIDVKGAGAAAITNSGEIFGAVSLTDQADTVTNSGAFRAYGESDFGAGSDLFTNTGMLTFAANTNTASFAGLERLDNAGIIDLADGAADDHLIMRDTTLRGQAGGVIQMDLDLRGATAAADRLTVGALEGVNEIELHVQGRGAVGDNGVTLIASGAAQTGEEVEVITVGGGFLDFNAVYDAASREFRVVAEAARQAFEPTRIASGAQTQWRRGADVVSARFDELRDSGAMGLRRGGTAQFWAQGFAGSEEVNGERRFSEDGTESVDLTHDVDARGAQFGVDIVRGLGGGDLVLGLAASVGETELTFQSNGDTAEFSGGGVGAYAHWSSGPVAIGVQAKADRYDLDYRFVSADLRDSAEGETIGARVDASWALVANGEWTVEPQGSLAWTDTDLDSIEGEAGEVEFGDTRSVLGKAGVRVARTVRLENGAVVQPFLGLYRLKEFDGENASRIHLNNQILDVNDPGRGTWTQVTAGANVGVGAIQGFAQGEATLGDVQGYTARVGVRLNW